MKNYLKQFLLLGIICMISKQVILAQGHVADSLHTLLANTKDERRKVSLLNELGRHYFFELGKQDSAIILIKKSREIAAKKGYIQLQIEGLMHLANHYIKNAKNEKLFSISMREALALAKQYGLKAEEAEVFKHLGLGYFRLGLYDSAKHYTDSALILVDNYTLTDKKADFLTHLAAFNFWFQILILRKQSPIMCLK